MADDNEVSTVNPAHLTDDTSTDLVKTNKKGEVSLAVKLLDFWTPGNLA